MNRVFNKWTTKCFWWCLRGHQRLSAVDRGQQWSTSQVWMIVLWITKITSYLNGSPSWIMMNFHKIVSFLKKLHLYQVGPTGYLCAIENLIFKLNWISISEIKFSIDIILIDLFNFMLWPNNFPLRITGKVPGGRLQSKPRISVWRHNQEGNHDF